MMPSRLAQKPLSSAYFNRTRGGALMAGSPLGCGLVVFAGISDAISVSIDLIVVVGHLPGVLDA